MANIKSYGFGMLSKTTTMTIQRVSQTANNSFKTGLFVRHGDCCMQQSQMTDRQSDSWSDTGITSHQHFLKGY